MKKIFLSIIGCALFFAASAQNDVQFTHFMFNKMAYNAAFAGNTDVLTLGAIYRNQWSGIDGAPQTLNVNAQTPFAKDRCGIGLSVTTDKIGMINTTFVELAYAYRIPFGKNRLSLGLNGRLEHGKIDWTKAEGIDPIDDMVPGADEKTVFLPNFGVGAVFSGDNFFAGISINQLLNNSYYQYNELTDIDEFKMRTIYLTGGVNFPLSSSVEFQPSVLVSHNQSAPFDLDINAGFLFLNTFFAGLSYRLDDSVDLLAMYQVTKQFRLGAAYDFTMSELRKETSGSFEIMAQYSFRYDDLSVKNIRFF